ncbi:flagellar hook-length control protein FliK [Kordiimonas sp. SCSIO 12603]|uniref:flagellar hook-length control protein FliK n=1 Tax=Kordiimonas sp. SCSIO 12603 TaxID=2829596 RepID=UPI002102DB86|nr:flagellar hook-length control protein FliK [Kordiimonas sp. SCSIO 12603]UTW58078.1 flagellar hook-length control protein FliK [Kordiimonas sp. SCSIO 12603]
MTAIDQLLQSFGASPAQALGALLGTNPAEGTEGTGEFAAALQAIKPSNLTGQVSDVDSENSAIYSVTAADGVSSVEEIIAQHQAEATPLTGDDLSQSAASGKPSLIVAEGRSKEFLEGIPGLQLTKLSTDQLTKIIESTQIVQEATDAPVDEPELFVFTGTPNDTGEESFHFLSIADLENLLTDQPVTVTPEQAQQETTAPPSENSAEALAEETATVIQQSVIDGSAQTEADTEEVAVAIKQRSAATPAPSTPTSQPNPESKTLEDAAIIAAAKETAQKTAKGEAVQVRADEKAAEGHGVQSQQAQQTAGATAQAATNKQANTNGKAASNGAQNKPSLATDSAQTKATPETTDTISQKTTENPTTRSAPVAQAQPTNTQPNQPPLTPERIAGFNGATATETFASGLSGLKGEGNFASTFSLLGGKPSPALGAHVAKQVNLQVSRAVRSGQNEFTVRLDPAELGRVQVKMSFIDGKVTTKIIAERPETLELMQREARGLERAMETGGHKASTDGISFSLDTGDGQSAGKSFAEAVQKERLDDQIKNGTTTAETNALENDDYLPETDLAALEEILSRVTPETGLDVRI